MANVLLTWELGGGLGHLINLRPLAVNLSRAGHRVFVALKDLSRGRAVFGKAELHYLQAPTQTRKVSDPIDAVRTFADLLHNVGFNDEQSLMTSIEAWRHLYEFVRPDLIVFDHSPTALLAAWGVAARRALVGTGFFCPPPGPNLPDMRSDLPNDEEQLVHRECVVMERMNRVIKALGAKPIDSVAELYAEVDENFLATFAELDHYPKRDDGHYWGAWPNGVGKRFQWPAGDGRRIYAYLKPFAALEGLLKALVRRRHPAVVYVDNVSPALQQQFSCETLRFEQQPLDLVQAGSECDLAILNGNHGTTVSMLLAGKPTLQFPLALEQILFTEAVVRLGAGMRGSTSDVAQLEHVLDQMLGSTKYRLSAQRFSEKYRSFDADCQVEKMVLRAEDLLREHPLPQRRPTIRELNPHDLLHPNRFDLLAKYIYAKHRKLGTDREWATQLYLDHLRVLNNFHEDVPPKRTPEDFLRAFDDVLDSIEAHGFDPQLPPVPVGSDFGLLNGAHRVAACLVHDRPVRCEIRDRPGYDFSAAWFKRRIRHMPGGFSAKWADAMALEYCRLKPTVCLLLLPADNPRLQGTVSTVLSERGAIVYGRRIPLSAEQRNALSVMLETDNRSGVAIPLQAASEVLPAPIVAFIWQPQNPDSLKVVENELQSNSSRESSTALLEGDAAQQLAELLLPAIRESRPTVQPAEYAASR